MRKRLAFVFGLAAVGMLAVASQAAVIGTVDVGDFGPGGFVDGGIAPAPQNVLVTGPLTATVVYTGQWGSEGGTANDDFNDSHIFDGEGNYTAHTGGSTMTVTINGLTSGALYDLALTWRDSGATVPNNRATNAPFTVAGLGGGDGTFLVNQEPIPNADFLITNPTGTPTDRPFQLLTSGQAAGTSITITLTNNADEFVVADAFALNLVPEPASMALMGLGGLLMLRRRRVA